MSLTLPAVYSSSSKAANIVENWIIQLYYGDESNFTPIASNDTTVENIFYHGVVTNRNLTIRSSIDLNNSTAKTGNISITLANFQYKSNDFSAEIFGGSNNYLNRTVKIYSQLNGEDTLSNCLQVYNGRLVDISHDNNQINLMIVERSPWDNIEIPQTKASDTNKYFPISYGNYTANSTSQDYRANMTVFPIPINEIRGDEVFALTGIHSISSTAYPHYYDRNLDRFLPVYVDDFSSFDTANESYKNGFAVRAYHKIPKKFKIKPVEDVSTDSWTNGDNAFDTPLANETSTKNSIIITNNTPGSTVTKTFKAKWLRPDHKVNAVTMTILYEWIIVRQNASDSALQNCTFVNNTWSFNDTFDTTDNSSKSDISGSTNSASVQTDASASMLSVFDSSNGWSDLTEIQAQCFISAGNAATSGQCTFTPSINDIRAFVSTEIDFTDKDQGYQALKGIEYLYCGGDGLDKSYNGGSGTATCGLEAHRDLLVRFTGYDDTDNNIYNWNSNLDIEDARIDSSAWNIRAWVLEPTSLKNILERIQYEFSFIFKFRADGSGSYWYIKNSYSSNDVAVILKSDDINNLNIATTPFSELITKMDIGFEKHPAQSSYMSNVTAEDSTNSTRSNLNIGAKENIQQVNLDYNVNKAGNSDVGSGNPNDGFADYYMNIYGDIKKIISCNIINPAKAFMLETGDIIQFSNTSGEMPIEPFGDNWGDYYMITDLKRSLGKVSITAREVG